MTMRAIHAELHPPSERCLDSCFSRGSSFAIVGR